MLVDDEHILNKIFSNINGIIVTHCEDEQTIKNNTALHLQKYGENIPMNFHPIIRSADACYMSSKLAVDLATKHQARLHIFHVSTEKELSLFRNDIPLKEKENYSRSVCASFVF
ncbi:MAG: hypothetical protein R2807_10605 [Chitinophagales bacterium]